MRSLRHIHGITLQVSEISFTLLTNWTEEAVVGAAGNVVDVSKMFFQ